MAESLRFLEEGSSAPS
jgi:hypothetical protein